MYCADCTILTWSGLSPQTVHCTENFRPIRGLEIGDRQNHRTTDRHFELLVHGSLLERWTKINIFLMTNCILAFIPLIKEIDTKIFSFFLVILKVVNFLWHTLYISAVTNNFCTACNLLQRHLQKYMYVHMVLTNWRESQYSYFCGFLYFGF